MYTTNSMNDVSKLSALVNSAQHVLLLQADNPDGDSLGSVLALEAIFLELGKKVTLACAVDMPLHLRFMPGWSRVQKELPRDFDITVIVDASTESLFQVYQNDGSLHWVKTKPVIVIDHHHDSEGLSYATVYIKSSAVATGEAIYSIARELNWPLPTDAGDMIAVSILSDSLGMTSEATTSSTYRVMAELIDNGTNIAKLDNDRKELSKKHPSLLAYKGKLLERVQFDTTGRIAFVTIPWEEIVTYSPLYNPSILVIDEMRQVTGVDIAIAYKLYKDGKITAKIRCNYGKGIAGPLALLFGGGGHSYAAGFKITDKTPLDDVITKVHATANEMLDSLKEQP